LRRLEMDFMIGINSSLRSCHDHSHFILELNCDKIKYEFDALQIVTGCKDGHSNAIALLLALNFKRQKNRSKKKKTKGSVLDSGQIE
jgi:hypothetical protein